MGGLLGAIGLPTVAQNPNDVARLLETGYGPMCDLSNANLSGANLEGANLSGAMLINADLSNTNLQYADLSHAVLNSANLSGSDFRFANLRNASLHGATMQPAADFSGANLEATIMPSGIPRTAPVAPQPSPTRRPRVEFSPVPRP